MRRNKNGFDGMICDSTQRLCRVVASEHDTFADHADLRSCSEVLFWDLGWPIRSRSKTG